MLKTKNLPRQLLLFSILKVSSCQTIHVLSISENFTERNWRKLKSLKPNRRHKMAMCCFKLRLKALISEVTVEQQILALVCYVSVALIRKIVKRMRIHINFRLRSLVRTSWSCITLLSHLKFQLLHVYADATMRLEGFTLLLYAWVELVPVSVN